VAPDQVNVGLGIIRADAQRRAASPRELFEETRRGSSLLDLRLRDVPTVRLKGWPLPGATEGRRIAGDGWLLVGDAGAMVDPFTGHGIHHAFLAAERASAAVATAHRGRSLDVSALVSYEEACRRDFLRSSAHVGLALQSLHRRPVISETLARASQRLDGVQWLFLSLVGHAAPRSALLSPGTALRALLRGPPRFDSRQSLGAVA
jgi:flavin-dependent dehydrogenase